MRSICVCLGAYMPESSAFPEAVKRLGKMIAAHHLRLIYGGSSMGMMGLLAHAVKDAGGITVGVITKQLIPKEKPSDTLDALHIVETMAERKAMMQDESDMFLVLPGGLGTLEETFDTWNAIKIGLFDKPLGFFNQDGYFDALFEFVNTCEQSGLIKPEHARIPIIGSDIEALLKALIQA